MLIWCSCDVTLIVTSMYHVCFLNFFAMRKNAHGSPTGSAILNLVEGDGNQHDVAFYPTPLLSGMNR